MKNIEREIRFCSQHLRNNLWTDIYSNINVRIGDDIRINSWVYIYRDVNRDIQTDIYEAIKENEKHGGQHPA